MLQNAVIAYLLPRAEYMWNILGSPLYIHATQVNRETGTV